MPDDSVLDLLDASLRSAALGTALELGLFWILDERPQLLADIAATLGIPPRRCAYWLQLLAQADLVEEGPAGFRPSSAARRAILGRYTRDTWAFLALEARERYPVGVDLSRVIRDRSTFASETQRENRYLALMAADPGRARRFTRMLYELHRALAEALTSRLDLTGVRRLLDVGGGSGVVSHALVRRHSDVTAVVVDIANVCEAGREIAAENGLENRVRYHAADFSSGELPGGFDFAIMCDVGTYDEALFRRIRAALNHNARFAIVDDFAPARGVAPASRATWALARSLADAEYDVPTADVVAQLLVGAGFSLVRRERLHVTGERDPLTILEAGNGHTVK